MAQNRYSVTSFLTSPLVSTKKCGKDTMSLPRFFSWRRIGERTCALACISVMTTAPAQYRCLHPLCAGSAACAARRFRLDETFFQCLHRDIYGTLPSLRTYGEAPLVFIVARGLCGAHIRSTVPCAALPSLSQGGRAFAPCATPCADQTAQNRYSVTAFLASLLVLTYSLVPHMSFILITACA